MRTRANVRAGRHFRMLEFDCSDGTVVPPHAYDDVRELCARFLDPLRDQFGECGVLSGYRTRSWNQRVGGARSSFHLYDLGSARGVAADVVFARGTPKQWAARAIEMGAGGVGRYQTFVHIDTRAARAQWRG